MRPRRESKIVNGKEFFLCGGECALWLPRDYFRVIRRPDGSTSPAGACLGCERAANRVRSKARYSPRKRQERHTAEKIDAAVRGARWRQRLADRGWLPVVLETKLPKLKEPPRRQSRRLAREDGDE